MAFTVLKNTNQETVIKVNGDGSETLALNDDSIFTAASQALVDGGTPTVNLITAIWVGEDGSTVTILRDGEVILSAPGYQPQVFDFQGQGFVDEVNNTSDLEVVITGEAAIYLTLRKVDGWATKIETATFSIYDDVDAVGS